MRYDNPVILGDYSDPDVIRKELVNFDNKFKQIIEEEK